MSDDISDLSRDDSAPATRKLPLLSLLQNTRSLLRRRFLIVLLISIPLWLYATTWDIVMMLFNAAADGHSAAFGDVTHLVLTRILLLPLLIGMYLLAVNVTVKRDLKTWFFLYQLAIGGIFSLLTGPTLAIGYYLTNQSYAASHSLIQSFDLISPWQIWLAKTVQYSIVYVLGLVLIFALNAFLRYKSEQLKSEQLRSKWLEVKLGTLRGQLNPHFFFNALNIIVALINTDPDRAERLLTELSALLRQSLNENDQEFNSVREEIRFIERYLVVMKARYEDRLQVRVNLEPEILDYRIPTFLLVPLVENAVKHGVAKVPGGSMLEITGRRDNRNLYFTVRNTTSAAADAEENKLDAGVGLRNTRQRLFAIYGLHYRFESNREAQGTWLTSVSIPEHRDPVMVTQQYDNRSSA
jgi:hypothetical protein